MKKLLLFSGLVLISGNLLSKYWPRLNYAKRSYSGSKYLSALSKDGAKADKTCFCGLHGDIVVAVNTDYSNCCYACNKAVSNFQGYGSHYLLGWSHGANATSYQPGAQGKNCSASDFNDNLVGPN